MEIRLEDLKIEEEFSIGDLKLDVIELKGNQVDLVVTPTYEEQEFYPEYGSSFGKVTVEAMESLGDVIDEQDEALNNLETSIDGLKNAVKLEELNVTPKQVEQEFVAGDGRGYDKVKVGAYVDFLARRIDRNAEPYEYEVPEYITQIVESAFSDDLGLEKLTMNCPNMTNSIGYMCSDCYKLKEAYIPYMKGTTNGRDFYNCVNLVKLYIPRMMFLGNSGLVSCGSLKYLQCESLERNDMTQNMYSCSALVTLYTPKLSKFGGSNSTQGMRALKDVIIGTSNCTLNQLLAVGVMEDANARFYVKPEYIETYKVATNWVTYADKIVGYEERTITKGQKVSLSGGSSYELSVVWYDTFEECASLYENSLTALDTGIVLVRVLDENGSVTNGIVYHMVEA